MGEYSVGKPEGFGQYKWAATGESYVGHFKEGLKSGSGRWRQPASDPSKPQQFNQYEGKYLMDLKHGKGCFTWEAGNKYIGEYKGDEREGWGEMAWIDGSTYRG